jgi:hypothetical protein
MTNHVTLLTVWRSWRQRVYGGHVTAIYTEMSEEVAIEGVPSLLLSSVLPFAVLRPVVVLVVSDCFPDDSSSYLVTFLTFKGRFAVNIFVRVRRGTNIRCRCKIVPQKLRLRFLMASVFRTAA